MRNKYRAKIEQLEAQGKFDEDVIPSRDDNIVQVDESYEYLPKSFKYRFFGSIIYGIVKLLAPLVIFLAHNPRIEGKKHLKAVQNGAISISNHVLHMDNLIIVSALWRKKIHFTASILNNKKGFRGFFLRAYGGMLPIATSPVGYRAFSKAVSTVLSDKKIVHFYPEHALWPHYEGVRPFKKGAFLFAIKNNVPILPMVFVFEERKGLDKIFKGKKPVLRILEPIMPAASQTAEQFMHEVQKICLAAYNKAN